MSSTNLPTYNMPIHCPRKIYILNPTTVTNGVRYKLVNKYSIILLLLILDSLPNYLWCFVFFIYLKIFLKKLCYLILFKNVHAATYSFNKKIVKLLLILTEPNYINPYIMGKSKFQMSLRVKIIKVSVHSTYKIYQD